MPDLLANLLLTFSGLDQLAPAIAAAIFFRGRLSVRSIIAGLAAGLIVVIAYTFWLPLPWAISEGIIGLGVNIAVVAICEGARAGVGRKNTNSSSETTGRRAKAAVHVYGGQPRRTFRFARSWAVDRVR